MHYVPDEVSKGRNTKELHFTVFGGGGVPSWPRKITQLSLKKRSLIIKSGASTVNCNFLVEYFAYDNTCLAPKTVSVRVLLFFLAKRSYIVKERIVGPSSPKIAVCHFVCVWLVLAERSCESLECRTTLGRKTTSFQRLQTYVLNTYFGWFGPKTRLRRVFSRRTYF